MTGLSIRDILNEEVITMRPETTLFNTHGIIRPNSPMQNNQQEGIRAPERATERLVEGVSQALRREFFLVGKSRVRSWHAWLAIGITVGIVSGILLVASRSLEIE